MTKVRGALFFAALIVVGAGGAIIAMANPAPLEVSTSDSPTTPAQGETSNASRCRRMRDDLASQAGRLDMGLTSLQERRTLAGSVVGEATLTFAIPVPLGEGLPTDGLTVSHLWGQFPDFVGVSSLMSEIAVTQGDVAGAIERWASFLATDLTAFLNSAPLASAPEARAVLDRVIARDLPIVGITVSGTYSDIGTLVDANREALFGLSLDQSGTPPFAPDEATLAAVQTICEGTP